MTITYLLTLTIISAISSYALFFHRDELKHVPVLKHIITWDERFTHQVIKLFK